MKASAVKRELKAAADPEKAAFYSGFFKAGPGQYAEGDRFVGVVVPEQRRIARAFGELPLSEVSKLLRSAYHEHRNTALLILEQQVRRGDETVAESVYDFVLEHLDQVNHWDLVDLAAPRLIGPRIVARPQRLGLLDEWAGSSSLWRRRMAMMSTRAFILEDGFRPTLKLARRLRDDPHDLIHKATGWMLREIGNRDADVLNRFLARHAARMPRTMLRYAIEKLPERQRKRYLTAGRSGT